MKLAKKIFYEVGQNTEVASLTKGTNRGSDDCKSALI